MSTGSLGAVLGWALSLALGDGHVDKSPGPAVTMVFLLATIYKCPLSSESGCDGVIPAAVGQGHGLVSPGRLQGSWTGLHHACSLQLVIGPTCPCLSVVGPGSIFQAAPGLNHLVSLNWDYDEPTCGVGIGLHEVRAPRAQ